MRSARKAFSAISISMRCRITYMADWTDSYSGAGFIEGVDYAREPNPMQDGVRVRIGSDDIREEVVRDGAVVATRVLSEAELLEQWNIVRQF